MKLNKFGAAHLKKGEHAEQQALDFLLKQGLKLIEKNYRCKTGELDLVMADQDTLTIIEVRFRQSDKFGGALESITAKKQSRIIAATEHYIMTKSLNSAVRFDVIAICGDQKINWIKNAFQN